MTDTPYITAASVTFVQDGNTMGTTANPEILIIEAEERQIADLIGYKRGLQKAREIQKQGNARLMVHNV